MGVALFFGLSGFLITELLLEEYERVGSIDFRAFYGRRVRRLLPALIASVAAVAAAGTVLGPLFFKWQMAAAALLYVGNWVLASGKNLASLTHTWSLAVEEQFYLLWPVILWGLARRGRRAVMVAAGMGTTIALVWFVWSVVSGAPWYRIYFSSEAAVMPLLVGAATAAWMGSRLPPVGKSRLRYVGWILIGIGACLPEMATITVTPVATAIAVALILPSAAAPESPVLQSRVLRWFGERSYSIYLYNGPFAFWLREVCHWPWWGLLLTVVPSGIVLGAASYRWVETPFRWGQNALSPQRLETMEGGVPVHSLDVGGDLTAPAVPESP